MNRYLKLFEREFSPRSRLIALFFEGVFFLLLFPGGLIFAGSWLDRVIGLPDLRWGALNTLLGAVLILAGWPLAMWAIVVQFQQGRGTPVPLMATQKLLVGGPFALCRNPMTLGSVSAYLGVAVFAASAGTAILVALFAAVVLLYNKLIEEQELQARFGDAYVAYKREVPFLIPRIRRLAEPRA